MRLHLPDGRYLSVETHSGAVWVYSYNGCGTVLSLTYEEAEEFGLAMWEAARKAKRNQRKEK